VQDIRGRYAVFLAFSAPTLIWLVLFFVVPLGIIWLYSFGENVTITQIETTWTLDNYKRILQPEILQLIGRSFWLAAVSTVICLLIGFPIGFKPLTLLGTPAGVVYGIVYVSLPFTILPVYSALERMDKSLLEASMDLGAGQWQTARNILIPLALPGIITASIITFIPALGQFLVPDLLGRGQVDMIANVIERQFKKANDWPFGSAISLTLLYATFIVLALRSFNDAARSKREGRIL